MSISVEKRIRLIDHLRTVIGDEDREMFSDAELDSYLRCRVTPGIWTEQLTAYKGWFYSFSPGPVIDLDVTLGVSGALYRADENTKNVHWISGSAGQPADNAKIEITYLICNFIGVVQDVMTIVATDRSKLAVRAEAEGIETDLTKLSSEIMNQVQRLAVIENMRQG